MSERVLSEAGLITLTGEISHAAVDSVIESILTANLSGRMDPLRLWIRSPGGSVDAGFALLDVMAWSKIPIHTCGIGLVGSMALLVLMAGARGHRILMPRTTVLSHRFSGASQGNHADMIATRVREDRLWELIVEHYATCTRLPDRDQMISELLRPTDRWLTADQAVALGMADAVWSPTLKECA
ncbi:MAG: hypothetical protein RLZZ127_508 [Planctomycetota bacterium]|jgi:ATP-dependent Clp protease protease subunit